MNLAQTTTLEQIRPPDMKSGETRLRRPRGGSGVAKRDYGTHAAAEVAAGAARAPVKFAAVDIHILTYQYFPPK